jgi:DNA-binding IclR family transcriptional regulator
MVNNKPYSGTQAVLRAIGLLKTFSDARPEWTLSQLARTVDLNKTTAYRLLTALESEGMVSRNEDTGAYRLGPEIIALGGRALRSNDLHIAGYSQLEALAQQVGEAATLEILVGNQVMILEEIPGSYLVATWQSIGTRYPAHATSTGKVLLAHLPEDDLETVLEAPLAPLTDKTITEPDELRRQLARVREQGYATAAEELEPDFVAVSAPVRNHDGDVVAAVGVGGPITRMTADRVPEIATAVKQTASTISSRIGFSDHTHSPGILGETA